MFFFFLHSIVFLLLLLSCSALYLTLVSLFLCFRFPHLLLSFRSSLWLFFSVSSTFWFSLSLLHTFLVCFADLTSMLFLFYSYSSSASPSFPRKTTLHHLYYWTFSFVGEAICRPLIDRCIELEPEVAAHRIARGNLLPPTSAIEVKKKRKKKKIMIWWRHTSS